MLIKIKDKNSKNGIAQMNNPDIILKNLQPAVLINSTLPSDVWGKEVAFKAGTRIQVTAPSARGKSTLVRMLYGLNRDFTGELCFNQTNSRDWTLQDWVVLRKNTLSVVFQDLRLFDDFSALENILVKAYLTQAGQEAQIKAMASRLGMGNVLDKKVRYMSLGEKQRIAILRSLVQPFCWLILDEPFSHLDAENRSNALSLILEECAKQAAGVLLTSLDGEAAFPSAQVVKI